MLDAAKVLSDFLPAESAGGQTLRSFTSPKNRSALLLVLMLCIYAVE